METKAEYARLEANAPPLSSPYFFTTPNTNAEGVPRCCMASSFLITFSTGFIAPTSYNSLVSCPASRRANAASALLRAGVFLEEPGLVCEYDRLHAVAEAEFLEDVRDVCLDG